MKSWETTASGIVTALCAIGAYKYPEHAPIITTVMGIFVSYGLIRARDTNVSSEGTKTDK